MINNKKDANSIFAILPYEILNYIIIHLPLHDRIQCIQVSKAWRSLFLSSSGMWSDISECNNMACNLVRYKLNGKDIHKVNLTTGANKQDGIDFLLRSGCSNINFLKTEYSNNSRLDDLLSLTGQALTELHIKVTFNLSIEDCFFTIFSSCPNLKRLLFRKSSYTFTLTGNNEAQEEFGNKFFTNHQVMDAMKNVQELRMSLLQPMAQEVYKQFLPLFTGLKHLYLWDFVKDNGSDAEQGFLDWIDDVFPSLQTIWLGHKFSNEIETSRLLFYQLPEERKNLAYDGQYIGAASVERFLKKHTPQKINAFHAKIDFNLPKTFGSIQRIVNRDFVSAAHHLRSLIIKNNGDDREFFFGRRANVDDSPAFDIDPILLHFPCLEQLNLVRINIKKNTITTTTTPSSPTTTHEDEEQEVEDNNDNNNLLPHYYWRSLKFVEFTYCKGFTARKLNWIIQHRFQEKMHHIRFFGMGDLLDHALDVVSENVQGLDRLDFGQLDLGTDTIRTVADSWSNKPLNSMHLCMTKEQMISQKDSIDYARQRLQDTDIGYFYLLFN